MPFLPRNIEQAAQKPKQTKLGEEGVLNKIETRGSEHWVKKWRGRHYRGPKTGSIFEAEGWKTSVSPFWPKLKYREAQLMHEAVPALTLKIHAAYDPRLSPKGESFDFSKGRPTTLAKNVAGDPKLRQERDALVDQLYDKNWASQIIDERGSVADYTDQWERHLMWIDIDVTMQKRFGTFLDVRRNIGYNTFLNQERIDDFVRQMNKAYAGTIITDLINAGIIPVHAEVNYIPTKTTGSNQTTGIFIETSIFDKQRLKQAILDRERQTQARDPLYDPIKAALRLDKAFLHLSLLEKLDECWDEVYYHNPGDKSNHPIQWDSKVATALFQILNALLKNPDKHFLLEGSIGWGIHSRLVGIRYAKNTEDGLQKVAELKKFVDEASMQDQEELAA